MKRNRCKEKREKEKRSRVLRKNGVKEDKMRGKLEGAEEEEKVYYAEKEEREV